MRLWIGSSGKNCIQYKRPKQIARYYQAADLYLHPARADTFPNTVLEALTCGTPVVASAVGGIPEQVVEGRTGFLVPVGDARAMAERVLALLADEGLRLQMGRQAAEGAARRFGVERVVGEYLAFYEEMMDEHKLLFKLSTAGYFSPKVAEFYPAESGEFYTAGDTTAVIFL